MFKDLDISDLFSQQEIEEAQDLFDLDSRIGQLDFIEALKEGGNRSAIALFMINHKNMIRKVFHNNVVGKSAKHKARRIANGEWEDFLAHVYEELYDGKMFRSFKPETFDKSTDLIEKLNWWVMQYIKTYAVLRNKDNMKRGATGIGRDDVDNSSVISIDSASEDNNSFEGEHLAYEDDLDVDFLERWNKLLKDPEMTRTKKGVSLNLILKKLVQGKINKLQDLIEELGISKVTFYTRQEQLADMLKKYSISGDDLMTAIRKYGDDKLIRRIKESYNPLLMNFLRMLD